MKIRKATYLDAPSIRLLLEALGYKTSISLLISQLENLSGESDHEVFVYESHKEVVAFVAVNYLSPLAFSSEWALISYLCVDETMRDQGIGKALEQHVTEHALKRKCDRIQLHCSECRALAHQFYEQQGYREYPKYFTKPLVDANDSSK